MITKYFSNIHFRVSYEFKNFFIISYGGKAYYACAYRDREVCKGELSSFLKAQKTFPKYAEGDFHFHHIVEKQHLADISFSGDNIGIVYAAMPTIMIHKSEHKRYDRLLHIGETRKLYMRTEQHESIKAEDKEKAVRKMFSVVSPEEKENAKKEIAERIDIMHQLYQETYRDNNLLKSIASNILRDYRSRLSEM